MTDTATDETAVAEEEFFVSTAPWWLVLVAGIFWLVYAFIVLSFDFDTVWAVAILAGITFCAAGVWQFIEASVIKGWRWLRILCGIAWITCGVLAFVWPGRTFLVLAAIIGWFFLFKGIFDIVFALVAWKELDVPWLLLIIGIIELGIGFWAAGHERNSIVLLVLWVAAAALFQGISDVIAAFQIRRLQQAAA